MSLEEIKERNDRLLASARQSMPPRESYLPKVEDWRDDVMRLLHDLSERVADLEGRSE